LNKDLKEVGEQAMQQNPGRENTQCKYLEWEHVGMFQKHQKDFCGWLELSEKERTKSWRALKAY
jgi:hypothetical protein